MNKETLQTPCFVVSGDDIKKDISDFRNSLNNNWANNVVAYSFKTNNVPGVIRIMKNNGLKAEVVSDDEYFLALELGYKKNEIIFNGPVKSKDLFIDAVLNGSIVNIDSKRELNWALEIASEKSTSIKVGIRANYCLENECPGESQCGKDDGRFGFSLETRELFDAIELLRRGKVAVNCLHMHCSSKTRSLNIYKSITSKACEIINNYKLNLEYLDIGGGFYGKMEGKPTFDNYFREIKEILDKNGISKELTLIAEPGVALIGRNLSYICSVIDFKQTKNNFFAVTDGSRIHIDPLQKKASYFYEVESKENDKSYFTSECTICGFTCMESDRFFSTKEQIGIGDIIIFKRVGAYTIGLAPLFIQFYPIIYLLEGNSLTVLRNKMTANEYIKIGDIL